MYIDDVDEPPIHKGNHRPDLNRIRTEVISLDRDSNWADDTEAPLKNHCHSPGNDSRTDSQLVTFMQSGRATYPPLVG